MANNATTDSKTLSEKERTRSKLMTPARRSNFQKTKDEELQKLADEIDPQPLGYSERMNDFTKDTEIKSGRQVVEENNAKKMAKEFLKSEKEADRKGLQEIQDRKNLTEELKVPLEKRLANPDEYSPEARLEKGRLFKKGGAAKMAKGGSASSRADGCAVRGKTRA
jgi:hypothetical protein